MNLDPMNRDPDAKVRRLARVSVPPAMLAKLLTPTGKGFVCMEGLPPDARVVAVDLASDSSILRSDRPVNSLIVLTLASSQFAALGCKAPIPALAIKLGTIEPKKPEPVNGETPKAVIADGS